jgi:hypothetical protein
VGALVPALRRVDGVCLIVGDNATRAEVHGIGHRHPVTLRVSVGLAVRLVEAGAPLTIRIESATPSEVGVPAP